MNAASSMVPSLSTAPMVTTPEVSERVQQLAVQEAEPAFADELARQVGDDPPSIEPGGRELNDALPGRMGTPSTLPPLSPGGMGVPADGKLLQGQPSANGAGETQFAEANTRSAGVTLAGLKGIGALHSAVEITDNGLAGLAEREEGSDVDGGDLAGDESAGWASGGPDRVLFDFLVSGLATSVNQGDEAGRLGQPHSEVVTGEALGTSAWHEPVATRDSPGSQGLHIVGNDTGRALSLSGLESKAAGNEALSSPVEGGALGAGASADGIESAAGSVVSLTDLAEAHVPPFGERSSTTGPSLRITEPGTQALPSESLARGILAPLVGSGAWFEELGSGVRWQITEGQGEATLRLNPAELGSLEVQVRMTERGAEVHFTTQHPQAREALEQGLARLREALEQQGLLLADASVSGGGTDRERQGDRAEPGLSAPRGPWADEEALDVTPAPILTGRGLIDLYA